MTTIEKKRKIKIVLDNFSEEQLDEALLFLEKVSLRDEKRKNYIKSLLIKEKNLFDRLAQ